MEEHRSLRDLLILKTRVLTATSLSDGSYGKIAGLPVLFLQLYKCIEDQFSYIGDNSNHNDIPGDQNNQLFKGLIDWVIWNPIADYSGVDDSPHY